MADIEKMTDEKILVDALEKYEECKDVCDKIYNEAIEDLRFSYGIDQWSEKELRGRDGRPSLVENRLNTVCNQVVNDQRQNKAWVNVRPVDNVTDVDTAEIINGLLRNIQYNSSASSAFENAFSQGVRGGIGYFRVITDYCNKESFDQEIKIIPVPSFTSVKFPFHLCENGNLATAPYCFVETEISKVEYDRLYPKGEETEFDLGAKGWDTDDTIKIAEFFICTQTKSKLYLLDNGEITDVKPEQIDFMSPKILQERTVYKKEINWYKLSSSKILEKSVFPGEIIPVIPVIGDICYIDGELVIKSLVSNAKDSQRMLNFWRSAEAERIALAPKSPYIAAEGQIEGYEQIWASANVKNVSVLPYKPYVESGSLVPAPQRQPPTPMDMAIVNAAKEAIDAIKATTGIFDASLGARSNESSGRAILARQREGDTANFHFVDNFAKSLEMCGRLIINIIPEIYNTERTVRILGEDLKEKIVVINGQNEDGKIYDLSTGKYDIVVETGPSFASKREETAYNIQQLSQQDPVLIQSTRDLLMSYLGLPAEVVQRVKKTIDPRLLDEKGDEDQTEQMKQQIAQSQEVIKQLDDVIQKMSAELEKLQADAKGKALDSATKLRIAELQAKVDVIIQQMKTDEKRGDRAHEIGINAMQNVRDYINTAPASGADNVEPTQPAVTAEEETM